MGERAYISMFRIAGVLASRARTSLFLHVSSCPVLSSSLMQTVAVCTEGLLKCSRVFVQIHVSRQMCLIVSHCMCMSGSSWVSLRHESILYGLFPWRFDLFTKGTCSFDCHAP